MFELNHRRLDLAAHALAKELKSLLEHAADNGLDLQTHVDLQKAGQTKATAPGLTRLQTLLCLGVPFYNHYAALEGWPVFPLPAYCTNQPQA